MTNFIIHSKQTAEPDSVALLDDVRTSLGFVPNLMGAFAESPAVLEAYLLLGEIFDKSSFTPTERQVVILAASRFNECHYCVAAHSVVAAMQDVPADVVAAIRNDEPIEDSRLETLRDFATAIAEKRGWVSDIDVDEFLAAGFTRAQVLEVILGVTFKTLSNYTNHVVDTPLDDAFASQGWMSSDERRAS